MFSKLYCFILKQKQKFVKKSIFHLGSPLKETVQMKIDHINNFMLLTMKLFSRFPPSEYENCRAEIRYFIRFIAVLEVWLFVWCTTDAIEQKLKMELLKTEAS